MRSARTTAPTPQTSRVTTARPNVDRVARSQGRPEQVGEGRRRQEAGERGERSRQLADRDHDAAQQQERDEQAVGQGEGRLGSQRAGHEQPEAGERECAQQERDDEEGRRCAGTGSPAEDHRSDRDQQDDLPDLDGQDGQHLGREQPAARQRRATEPLEDPVVALVGGGDTEVDEAGRDDRQRQGAGQEEVDRWPTPRRQDRDRGEEEQDDDGDDDRDQDVLAATRGQPQLHPGLGGGRRGKRCGLAHPVTSSRPAAEATAGAPTSSRYASSRDPPLVRSSRISRSSVAHHAARAATKAASGATPSSR